MSIWNHQFEVHSTMGFMTSFAGIPQDEFSYFTKAVRTPGTERANYITELWKYSECPFCSTNLQNIPSSSPSHEEIKMLLLCSNCGWWKALYETNLAGGFKSTRKAGAILKVLDLADLSLPITELRDFLTLKYEKRFDVNPKLYEEVVASVFRDLGYLAVVTAYSKDGGIDVILEKDSQRIGVQVKRYKDKISVNQIRELTGALVRNKLTEGIFVTTSGFTKPSKEEAAELVKVGYKIELIDAERFLDSLEITKRTEIFKDIEEFEVILPLKYLPTIYHGPGRVEI